MFTLKQTRMGAGRWVWLSTGSVRSVTIEHGPEHELTEIKEIR